MLTSPLARTAAQARPAPILPAYLAAAGLLLGASCASYADRTAAALRDFQGGHLLESMEAYGDTEEVGSKLLSGAEAGTVNRQTHFCFTVGPIT